MRIEVPIIPRRDRRRQFRVVPQRRRVTSEGSLWGGAVRLLFAHLGQVAGAPLRGNQPCLHGSFVHRGWDEDIMTDLPKKLVWPDVKRHTHPLPLLLSRLRATLLRFFEYHVPARSIATFFW